MYIALMI